MKKLLIIVIGTALCVWLVTDLWARGGRGGGGGRVSSGSRGGGGARPSGGSRSAASRTPSMSRPSTSSVQRPSGGGSNRSVSSRPATGKLPTPNTRPSTGGNRPGSGNTANRPGARPGGDARPGAGSRPVAGNLPANGRPSSRDLQNFLDLPNAGGGNVGSGRPSSGLGNGAAGVGSALAGGAAAEFLQNRPNNALPGEGGRPGGEGAGPGGGKPDAGRPGQPGNRPNNSLPSQGGNRLDMGRPGQPGNRPGDVGRPGAPRDRVQNLPSRIADRGQWQNWRNDHIGDIGEWWGDHRGDYGDWFGDNWWDHNHVHHPYYPGFGFWAGAAWGGLVGWIDYGWSEPVYYNYGDNVYYEDGSVYYGDQPVCTELQYIEQAEAIAESQPETKPTEKDWMPLGVFAITQDGEPTGAEPTMFLQLAVSKQGVINGTFQNTVTKVVKTIEGMVDKETQRAAWTAAGESRPLMEVGIVNLTQDATPALIHFPDNSTQSCLLVRLEKPETSKKLPQDK